MTHIDRVDLNLLPPLAALLEERHVSRAAQRVNLSQPAMSRALQRLREVLGDELLVRGSAGYELTPRAERVQRQLVAILPRLEILFAGEAFDPAAAAESFRLAGTDYPAMVFGPALFQQVFRQSPHSTVTFRGWHDGVFDDLARGLTDIVFYGVSAPPALRSEKLFEETFVCVMSADHPLSGRSRLDLDDYLRCSHVVVNIVEGDQTVIDRHLQALGTPRRASLSVPYHAAAPLAVPGTRLVATLPLRLVAQHAQDPALRLVPAPEEIKDMSYHMSWHPRLDDDPAQRWLRHTIRTVTAAI
ncbi:LysR family transcriptional regulator [Streptacidiphilus sp. PAMC 29251]